MDGLCFGEGTVSYCSMACTALFAWLRAERRPYKRAQRSQYLDHILDEVILYLGAFHDHKFTPLGSQGGLDILGAETHSPVTMLDHDRLHLGIGQELEELGTASVPAGTDLGYAFNHGHAVLVSVNDEAA